MLGLAIFIATYLVLRAVASVVIATTTKEDFLAVLIPWVADLIIVAVVITMAFTIEQPPKE